MADKSSVIVHKVAEILEIHKRVSEKLEDYLETSTERPDIAYELLKMLVIADELLEYVNPSKTIGEIYGIPKEAVIDAKEAYEFSNKHGWDFSPWFQEKASHVKNGVLNIIKYWEKEPSKVKLVEDAPMTPVEWVKDGIDSGLHRVKVYAETIFEMLCEDQISVEAKESK